MLTIRAAGDWREDQVHVRRVDVARRIVPEVEAAIDAAWAEMLARPGVHLFNGVITRFISFHAKPDRLDLELGQTDYKVFVGTNMAHPEFVDRFGSDVMANPVGVSPLLISADNYIVMGRRKATLAYYPGWIHPFAGSMDPSDSNPFAAVHRELQEELSISPTNLAEIRLTGIVEDHRLWQSELIFYARSSRTRDELIAAVDDEEHHDTWSIACEPDQVAKAQANQAGLTPVALGAMLLYGRLRFGRDWFDRQYASIRQSTPNAPQSAT